MEAGSQKAGRANTQTALTCEAKKTLGYLMIDECRFVQHASKEGGHSFPPLVFFDTQPDPKTAAIHFRMTYRLFYLARRIFRGSLPEWRTGMSALLYVSSDRGMLRVEK